MDVYYEPKCYEHWGVLDLLQGTEDKKKKNKQTPKMVLVLTAPRNPSMKTAGKEVAENLKGGRNDFNNSWKKALST